MPIDTRFLKAAKDQVNAAARSGMSFARANPRASLGSAAAMLIAPAVFKNDNRGYLQTASITTPLIMTGTMAAPSIIGAFRSQFSKHSVPTVSSLRDKWKNTKDNKVNSFEDIAEATQKYSEGSVPLNVYQDVARKHYAGRMKRSPNLTEESNALLSHLKGREGKPGLLGGTPDSKVLDYISNSIHAEKLRTLGPSGLIQYGAGNPLSMYAPMLDKDQILTSITEQLGNASFVRGMNSRLQRMKNFVIPNNTLSRAAQDLPSTHSIMSWGMSSDVIKDQLKAQDPEAYGLLQKLVNKPGVDPYDVELSILNEANSPIARVSYKGLEIPLIQKNGSIRVGKFFRHKGDPRWFYSENNVFREDIYGLTALVEGFSHEAISKELSRANICGGIDSNDDWHSVLPPGNGEYNGTTLGSKLRRKNYIPSELSGNQLFGFRQVDGKTNESKWVGYSDLDAENSERILTSMPAKHGLTVIGPETSSAAKGVFQSKELENLVPYPVDVERQLAQYRAWSKGTRLSQAPELAPGSITEVRDRLTPFYETEYSRNFAPNAETRAVAVRSVGVTAGERALFGNLPEAVDELSSYTDMATQIIGRERGVSKEAAIKSWMEYSHWLSNPKNLRTMKRIGELGEGGVLTKRNLYGMGSETIRSVDVAEDFMKDSWLDFYGVSLEEHFGAAAGSSVPLGILNGNYITGGGTRNYIEGREEMGEGIVRYNLRESHAFGVGTKIDKEGKFLVTGDLSGEELSIMQRGLNKWYESVGSGGHVSKEVNFIQPIETAQWKQNPNEAAMNILGDTFRRLDETGELEKIQSHVQSLKNAGYSYESSTGTILAAGGKDKNWNNTVKIIEDMFADVSMRIRKGLIVGDEHMRMFALSGDESYMEYTHQYNNPSMLSAWNSTKQNVSSEVSITYDMLQQLSLKGYHGTAKDLTSRLREDGSKEMTAKLEEYLKGDTKAITESHSLFEGVKTDDKGNLFKGVDTAEGRQGTFLDSDLYSNNYTMKLPDGREIPVPGHDAYGGKVNRYGMGKFSASQHEKDLMSLVEVYKPHINAGANASAETLGLLNKSIATDADKAIKKYIGSLSQFVYGKNSYYRNIGVDKLSVNEFLLPRVSSLKYADKSVNPFQAAIGADMAEQMGPEIRNALLPRKGKPTEAFALIERHPIGNALFYQLTVDPKLNGTNAVAFSEGSTLLHRADFDQDPMYLLPVRKGSGENPSESWLEASNAVTNKESLQAKNLTFMRKAVGLGDDPTSYFTMSQKELSDINANIGKLNRSKPLLDRLNAPVHSIEEALRVRSTSKSIGAFANTLTKMLVGLEHNTGVTSLESRMELNDVFFELIKQSPISSSKLKSGIGMTYSKALGINSKLLDNLSPKGDFEKFNSAMLELARNTDANAKGTFFTDYLSSHRDVLKAYHSGVDWDAAGQTARVLTTQSDKAYKAKTLGMDPNMMPYLHARQTEEELAAVAEKASGVGQEVKNVVNRFGSATREVSEAIRGNKTKLLIGAGIAIAAGIITTSIRPTPVFGRNSGNSYNTEDGAGVSNTTPGAAREGSRASRPKRRLVNSVSQTRTAIVAPLGDTADLDVRMRATDRSRTIETAKMLSRVATDGDSNITINYNDNKHTSLRSKERMKDMLDN